MTALATLAPISLGELTERASLLTRVDRKYVVPRSSIDALLERLADDAMVLEIDGLRASDYESMYFDTDGLDSYLAAARGRRRRFKVRTRAYLDSAECYLEVKTRGGRSLTVKERVAHPVADRAHLTREGGQYVDFALRGAGIDGVGATALHPTLITRYRRTTLFVPADESRATIDVDLSWSQASASISTPELAIVETKSGSTPSSVDRLLWRHGHRPASISKYGVGLAALHPDLPSNKWRRVLDRQLLPAIAAAQITEPSSRSTS